MYIIQRDEHYQRTESGKSWQANPYETEKPRRISRKQYYLTVNDDTVKFFRHLGGSETVERSYTRQGYLVTKITSCNPDRSYKHVRYFKIS